MLLFSVLLIILSFKHIYGHANVKVVKLPNNVTIKTTYSNFKKHENVRIYGVSMKSLNVQTKVECASQCMRTKGCNTIAIRKNTPPPFYCGLFKGNLDTNHYYAMDDVDYDVYETENMCALNPLICEHGSVCIPNFNNNTYYCQWCFPPYYGKHCNLTANVTSENKIPEDVLTGKNASCKSLRKYFGELKDGRFYDTYPWRDDRIVRVTCTANGATRIGNVNRNHSGPIKKYITTVTNPLDIPKENFRISTTVLNVLYKLTRFKRFSFYCTDGLGLKSIVTTSLPTENVVNMLKYFIGESNILPNSCHTMDEGPNCNDMENEKWSTEGIDVESRIYNQVFRYGSDVMKGLSMADHKYGCHDVMGEYKANGYYDILVE